MVELVCGGDRVPRRVAGRRVAGDEAVGALGQGSNPIHVPLDEVGRVTSERAQFSGFNHLHCSRPQKH